MLYSSAVRYHSDSKRWTVLTIDERRCILTPADGQEAEYRHKDHVDSSWETKTLPPKQTILFCFQSTKSTEKEGNLYIYSREYLIRNLRYWLVFARCPVQNSTEKYFNLTKIHSFLPCCLQFINRLFGSLYSELRTTINNQRKNEPTNQQTNETNKQRHYFCKAG